ncbi:hypothetical protein QO058_22130 [Bosea vestrisii]|uniref:hypothetical protein n=1 Tax=Bosea vestrisii TaxID=151416 RepID=UPI0024E01D07|nr:hypothetical protein [Bosea vestrisii]WID95442.1 hypothetical protein QO058_22130 [Bosea vestrisii]
MRPVRTVFALCCALLCAPPATAGEKAEESLVSTAVVGLRGGFDSSPTNSKGEKGSPTLTGFASWNYLRGTVQDGYGLDLLLVDTQYDPRQLAASRLHTLMLKHATGIGENLTLQSSLALENEQTWSRRRSSLTWRERLNLSLGSIRLFANAEARLAALNERNVFASGDFLPQDENLATLGITPGIAWRQSETEIGVSFMASRTRFTNGTDYLGMRRDNYRLQPNLFVSTALKGATFEASLSPLQIIFPDKEFENEKKLLYTAKLRVPYEWLTLDLSSGRTVEDTTLPFAVVNLVTQHEGKLTARFNDTNALSLTIRQKLEDYLGLDSTTRTASIGLDYARGLGNGMTATASAGWRKTKDTGLEAVPAFVVQLGLQKQLDFSDPGKTAKKGG